MLYECRVILPHYQANGEPVDHTVKHWLEKNLVGTFGGFTHYTGDGGMIMADGQLKTEGVEIYDVAIREDQFGYLVLIALGVLRRAKQETVYVRDGHGRAFIGANAIELGACVPDVQ